LVHLGGKDFNIPHTMDIHQEHFFVCAKFLNVVIFFKEYFVAIFPIFEKIIKKKYFGLVSLNV
jgi:hypothetical protein